MKDNKVSEKRILARQAKRDGKALNKLMYTALKAITYSSDIELEKSYKLERKLKSMRYNAKKANLYEIWDFSLEREGYDIPVRIFYPDDKDAQENVIMYLHGGGFVTGDIDSFTNVCINISNATKSVVISVDYRLAPEYRFPTAVYDCYFVMQRVIENLGYFNGEKKGLTIMGDSAGANLCAAISLMARNEGGLKAKRQILLYPATNNDHSESSPFKSIQEYGTDFLLTSKRICEYMDFYKSKESDKQSEYFAPLLAKDFSSLPDTLIITGEYDPLRDEGEEYGRRLSAAGNYVQIFRMKNGLHGFITLPPRFKAVRESMFRINKFLGRHDLLE